MQGIASKIQGAVSHAASAIGAHGAHGGAGGAGGATAGETVRVTD